MGCYRIWIGSESGSQRILDAMERGVTAEQVQWATQAAQRHGIQVGMFLMWGYEGETLEDIEATIEHVKKANPDVFFTTVAYPIKNTAYFTPWPPTAWCPHAPGRSRPTATALIRGRHSRAYYKQADRWLRSEVGAPRRAEATPRWPPPSGPRRWRRARRWRRWPARWRRERGVAARSLRRRWPPATTRASPPRRSAPCCAQAVQRRLDARFAPGSRVLEMTAAPARTPSISAAAACGCSPPTPPRR